MPKNRDNKSGIDILFTMLMFAIIVIVSLLKWIVTALIAIVLFIVRLVKLGNKEENTKYQNIRPNKTILTKYDNLFNEKIRQRGIEYYRKDKVEIIEESNSLVKALVQGTSNYNVEIKFDDNHKIISTQCSCPYYKDKKQNCKHIYATILAYENSQDEFDMEEEYDNEYEIDSEFEDDEKINKQRIPSLEQIAIITALKNQRKNEKIQEQERKIKEYKNYGLFDEEIREIEKGSYDIGNFEEQELDEDDFYYEDDDNIE